MKIRLPAVKKYTKAFYICDKIFSTQLVYFNN